MMKERIARALYNTASSSLVMDKVDAVLAALREPTPEMIAVISPQRSTSGLVNWQAMIDAAISPPEGMGEER